MDPIRNPFTPGAGTRPPFLAGRDREIDQFERLINRLLARRPEKSLMITGLRGVGKTVLLSTFADIATNSGFQTAHHEITESVNFPDTVARMTRKLLLSMSPVERMKDRSRKAAGILKAFSIKIPDGPQIGFDVDAVFGTADSGDLAADLPELMIALGEAAVEAGSGVLYFFDEIHYVPKKGLEALIAAVHQVGQRDLPVAIIGAGLPQLPGLAGQAKSYAERLFDFPWIGSLDFDDAVHALEEPAENAGVAFEEEALASIVELAEGYPYFLQEYGKHIWNIAPKSPIRMEDVEQGIDAVQAQLDENFFLVRIWKATPLERTYLSAMAQLGDRAVRTAEIAERLGRKPQSLGPTRANLIHKGLIYSPEYGLADFSVPKFGDFMRRTYPT